MKIVTKLLKGRKDAAELELSYADPNNPEYAKAIERKKAEITELEQALLILHSVSGSDLFTKEQVKELVQECCGEIYCDDGNLKGKSPSELYKWMDKKKLI